MITLRPANERGQSKLDWLDSWHTFSFADYRDDKHVHFGPLRVINEDIIAPGQGFGAHPHNNMEIITYIIDGELEHKDSLGTGEVIHTGEVQRMSAGTGVVHSEFNHSKTKPVHLLQIWILPEKLAIDPGYEQKKIEFIPNQWKVIADKNGQGDALTIHQDVVLSAACISNGKQLAYSPRKDGAWLQIVKGSVTVNGLEAKAGDGLAVVSEPSLDILANTDSEILLFDIPKLK